VAAVHPFGLSWDIVISEIISQCATCILLYENYVMMIIDELFDFQICVLCCVVRINGEIIYHNIFCDNYWFILVI